MTIIVRFSCAVMDYPRFSPTMSDCLGRKHNKTSAHTRPFSASRRSRRGHKNFGNSGIDRVKWVSKEIVVFIGEFNGEDQHVKGELLPHISLPVPVLFTLATKQRDDTRIEIIRSPTVSIGFVLRQKKPVVFV